MKTQRDLNNPETMYEALRYAISEDLRSNCTAGLAYMGVKMMTHPKELRLAREKEKLYACCEYSKCNAKRLGSELFRCGGCKVVLYCAKKCQKEDWAEHKDFCKLLQKERVEGEKRRAGSHGSKGKKKSKSKKRRRRT